MCIAVGSTRVTRPGQGADSLEAHGSGEARTRPWASASRPPSRGHLKTVFAGLLAHKQNSGGKK